MSNKRVKPDYTCNDCGRVFPIDPTDPMTAHGDYLDHMDEHEREDAEADELVMSSGLTAPEHFHPVRSWAVDGCARCEIESNSREHQDALFKANR